MDGGVIFPAFTESVLNRSIIDRFETIAAIAAERIALSDKDRTITYSELLRFVRSAAAKIVRAGLESGPIAVLMPHEARFPAAILAVLAAGKIHVPLDANHPIERNCIIAENAGAAAVVSLGDTAARAAALFPRHIPVLDVESLAEGDDAPAASGRAGPDDIAQILYTSGSTGTPKGVYTSHRNCLHGILRLTSGTRITGHDKVALLYSPSVIAGIRLSLGALLNGAALHVLSPQGFQPAGLASEIRLRGITVYASVPALFRQVFASFAGEEPPSSIRVVRLGGDRVDWSDVDLLRRHCPDAAMMISLGSSECSSHYAEWIVDAELHPRGARLPVGRPFPDIGVEILDEDSVAVPDGDVGEFVVSGRHLALGYWRAPELTAAAFGESATPGIRTFRTGDMGLRRPDGLLEFVGRRDHQIKLRGHRIETGEIESVLRTCPGVHDAAIVSRQDETGRPRAIIAYVEGAPGKPAIRSGEVLARLGLLLPHFMVPAAIVVVEALPRLASHKIDRGKLAEIDVRRSAERDDGRDDPIVDEIATLFERLLGVSGARAHDGFVALGGDSLQAVAATVELERRFHLTVPAELLGEMATIRDLADWIAGARR